MLPHNPATGVTMRRTKKAGERMLGFQREEVATILTAAAQQTDRLSLVRRSYVPSPALASRKFANCVAKAL